MKFVFKLQQNPYKISNFSVYQIISTLVNTLMITQNTQFTYFSQYFIFFVEHSSSIEVFKPFDIVSILAQNLSLRYKHKKKSVGLRFT